MWRLQQDEQREAEQSPDAGGPIRAEAAPSGAHQAA
jgi:hypothetical protein